MENENRSKNKSANRAVAVTEPSLSFSNRMLASGAYFKHSSVKIMLEGKQAWMSGKESSPPHFHPKEMRLRGRRRGGCRFCSCCGSPQTPGHSSQVWNGSIYLGRARIIWTPAFAVLCSLQKASTYVETFKDPTLLKCGISFSLKYVL